MARDPKIDRLRQVSLFSKCTDKELAQVASLADEADLPKGSVLCREGERADAAYVIVAGTAEVTTEGRYLARLGPGDVVGELALILRGNRGATVRLSTDGRVVSVPANQFVSLLESTPSLAMAVLREMAERVQRGDHPAQDRVAQDRG